VISLQAITPEELALNVSGITLQEARKIVSAIHRFDSLPSSIRSTRRISVEAVRAVGSIPRLAIRGVYRSTIDPFVKYSLATSDEQAIETVRIPLEHPQRFSACVSSQAGCALGCTFCATGKMGLRRNLESWEIIEQVRTIRRDLDHNKRQRLHGIVFQGMGEPLANLNNVVKALQVMSEPCALAVDGRNITVCTAGIPDGIRRLAREAPNVRLAISIGSPRAEVRSKLMPISRAYPFESVFEAAVEHARITRLAPMWALTLLAGINDAQEDAHLLADYALAFARHTGFRPRISTISYNPVDTSGPDPFSPTSVDKEQAFRKVLHGYGLAAHRRYSGGADVLAACGQLACRESASADSPGTVPAFVALPAGGTIIKTENRTPAFRLLSRWRCTPL
jgi:23S rRNA (adenine2503-C2)-methyltransferase